MTEPAIAGVTPIPLPVVGRSEYPAVGVVAVMMGAVISTLNARLTTQGLADIRGALGLGFDDGSWINTIFAAAQMVVTPARAAAIATTIQIARWLGNEIGGVVLQTFVRVREQVYSNLIGLHVVTGLQATEQATAQLASPFGNRATGIGEPGAQGTAVLASLVRREAYVWAYIDAF